jgi:hypothetical protein
VRVICLHNLWVLNTPPLASFFGFRSLTLSLGFFALAAIRFFGILLTSFSLFEGAPKRLQVFVLERSESTTPIEFAGRFEVHFGGPDCPTTLAAGKVVVEDGFVRLRCGDVLPPRGFRTTRSGRRFITRSNAGDWAMRLCALTMRRATLSGRDHA